MCQNESFEVLLKDVKASKMETQEKSLNFGQINREIQNIYTFLHAFLAAMRSIDNELIFGFLFYDKKKITCLLIKSSTAVFRYHFRVSNALGKRLKTHF